MKKDARRHAWVLFLSACLTTGCAAPSGDRVGGADSPVPGDAPSGLVLRDPDGHAHRPLQPGLGSLSVVIFTMTDCPIANAFGPEINRLVEAYAPQGVRFYLVHTDPDTTPDDAREHAAEYGVKSTVLTGYRSAIALAQHTGATITPEAVVINASGAVVYRGRINNFYEDFGVKRAAPNRHELRDALDATLAGRWVEVSRTEVIGCTIPMGF